MPVLALSQLSRAVEQREDKRPQLADLRESGTIEQDADVVMFIFREEYYLERAEPSQRPTRPTTSSMKRHQDWKQRCEQAHNLAEVMIAKQRHGPIGTVKLFFEGEFTRFGDLDPRDTADVRDASQQRGCRRMTDSDRAGAVLTDRSRGDRRQLAAAGDAGGAGGDAPPSSRPTPTGSAPRRSPRRWPTPAAASSSSPTSTRASRCAAAACLRRGG